MSPLATYRLQLTSEFGFKQAADLADYLQSLGISHLYTSPFLVARPGSTHGYDVVDPSHLNPELGAESGFALLADALRRRGLKLLLDFIPNHMGVGGAANAFWLDVLEWGPDSVYADWFDIDWQASTSGPADKVLVPLLGNQYGVELENGALTLKFDESNGTFAVWAYDTHKLPICPRHYGHLWHKQHRELEVLADAYAHLPPRYKALGVAEKLSEQLRSLLEHDPSALDVVRHSLQKFRGDPGDSDSWRRLDRLIQKQHWRAAYFRVASDDINYRRFFNINELAGLRMENPAVFDYSHRLVLDLMRRGLLHGLRIDHVDGLFDPKAYLGKLRAVADANAAEPPYIIVEKILARHESLREDWPIAGTTGYDFIAQVTGLLVDHAGEDEFTRIYREFTGDSDEFALTLRESKLEIVSNEMAGELRQLARDAATIAHQCSHSTDFTQNLLERALRQVVACFPVYRTYVDPSNEPTADDRRDLQWAIEQARSCEMAIDQSVFDFLMKLLTGDLMNEPNCDYSRTDVYRFAMRFQQYTVPVMAKGLEDTAFYRYPRLFALSEVGSRPDQFGLAISAFHKANIQRQKRWPETLLATSTHDTKLGEDARARLAVLSEISDEWERQVKAWTRLQRAGIGGTEGEAPPDRTTEYLFYQLLLATWPTELTLPREVDPGALAAYGDRMRTAMIKVCREPKRQTSWVTPNAAYEDAVLAFVDRTLDLERSQAFLSMFRPFQEWIARLGLQNSFVQTVLKLTSPGVPDIYQGSELLNLSLMDPDNRRPLDFDSQPDWGGRAKRDLIAKILRYRGKHSLLFSTGDYDALAGTGPGSEQVIAFTRKYEAERILIICARYPAARERSSIDGTFVPLTNDDPTSWTDVITGRIVKVSADGICVSALIRDLPVAVLVPE